MHWDARDIELKEARVCANEWRAVRHYDLLPMLIDYLKPMVLLSINTGVRRGELFDLCWHHVDLKKSIMTIIGDNAKSGKTRHIPLNSEAKAALTVSIKKIPTVLFFLVKMARA